MKPKNGTNIIILSPDKILLFHRDNIPTIPSPDCWHLVGGGIETRETPEQALVREVKEEASYDLKIFQLITKTKGRQGQDVWLYVTFVSKADESKFSLGPGEGQAIGWFTLSEALSLSLTPGTKILLTKYRKLLEKMMTTRSVSDTFNLILFPPKNNVVN